MINNAGYWPYRVTVGDILRDAAGNYRVVRSATQGKSGYTTHVVFVIRRPSWTGRPYTVKSYIDLKQGGFVPTGARANLTLRTIDRRIDDAIGSTGRTALTAADVFGMVI